MKIIKKPKIPDQTCSVCGCVIKIGQKDLIFENTPLKLTGLVKNRFKCPICCFENRVNFKENKTEEKETAEESTEDSEK